MHVPSSNHACTCNEGHPRWQCSRPFRMVLCTVVGGDGLGAQGTECLAGDLHECAYESFRRVLLLDVHTHERVLPRSQIAEAHLHMAHILEVRCATGCSPVPPFSFPSAPPANCAPSWTLHQPLKGGHARAQACTQLFDGCALDGCRTRACTRKP